MTDNDGWRYDPDETDYVPTPRIPIGAAIEEVAERKGIAVGPAMRLVEAACARRDLRAWGYGPFWRALRPTEWHFGILNHEAYTMPEVHGIHVSTEGLAAFLSPTAEAAQPATSPLGKSPKHGSRAEDRDDIERASNGRHKGGRPDVVRQAVTEFWGALADPDRALSNTKLAAIYKSECRGGDEGTVRKIIAELRRIKPE